MSGIRMTYPTAAVLQALARGHRYGFEIVDATSVLSGTAYPILRRLEEAGIVRGRWENSAVSRQAGRPPRRYYELTGRADELLRSATARFPELAVAPAPGAEGREAT